VTCTQTARKNLMYILEAINQLKKQVQSSFEAACATEDRRSFKEAAIQHVWDKDVSCWRYLGPSDSGPPAEKYKETIKKLRKLQKQLLRADAEIEKLIEGMGDT
jgi:hypothetical protein